MSKTLPATGEILFQGITVNEFSTGYNFEQAKSSGIGGAILRATAGRDYTDARLGDAVQAVKDAGLRLGFYHYLNADDEAEARLQAQFFARTIAGFDYDLRPAMLFGPTSGLSFDAVNRIALAFLSTVRSAAGVAPVVYTDAQSANLLWSRAVAEDYPLWVIDDSSADAPAAGNSPWSSWIGWQYRRSLDPACRGTGTPLSRFTASMLRKQIVIPKPPESGDKLKLICVTVSYGDTLSGIARLFNTTVSALVRLNDIDNPNLIYPGQRLYLWVNASVPYACCDNYIVRRGDTLSSIAERFGLDWRRVASINEIANPDLIFPGQTIKLGVCG
ncbi:MAG: LysM peptidoglycan-binding domain-containing protein [Eubacteriales bacterium]|nr:LysM peptidoglycan-binding domain-containing protein [Eubacteriales bacterium]